MCRKKVHFASEIFRHKLDQSKKLPNLEYHCDHLGKCVRGKTFVLKLLGELVFALKFTVNNFIILYPLIKFDFGTASVLLLILITIYKK